MACASEYSEAKSRAPRRRAAAVARSTRQLDADGGGHRSVNTRAIPMRESSDRPHRRRRTKHGRTQHATTVVVRQDEASQTTIIGACASRPSLRRRRRLLIVASKCVQQQSQRQQRAAAMVSVWWAIDVSGSLLGLPLNALLIITILRASTSGMASYTRMLLAGAAFDLFFDIVELATQHVRRVYGSRECRRRRV